MTRPLLDSEWTRCFLLLTFDKSIRKRMISTWCPVSRCLLSLLPHHLAPQGETRLIDNSYVSITLKDQYQIL